MMKLPDPDEINSYDDLRKFVSALNMAYNRAGVASRNSCPDKYPSPDPFFAYVGRIHGKAVSVCVRIDSDVCRATEFEGRDGNRDIASKKCFKALRNHLLSDGKWRDLLSAK